MTLHTDAGTMKCLECEVVYGRSVDHFNECRAAIRRGNEYKQKHPDPNKPKGC